MNTASLNILISGIGGPTPKGVAKSLRLAFPDVKLYGTDAGKYGPGLYDDSLFDKTYLVPKSVSHPYEYWEVMDKIINHHQIDFAFIIPETEVLEWSRRKAENKLPCNALIPDFKVANFLFDKYKVSQILYPYNLAPKTVRSKSKTIEDYETVRKLFNSDIWIRINKTAGAIGALKIANIEDFQAWQSLFGKYKDGIILSDYLPGRNYAVKILYKDGKVVLAACAERIEYLLANAAPSKISGMCSRGKLLNREDLYVIADRAIRIIFNKHQNTPNGFFTVDLKEDLFGQPKITEINLRPVSFNHAFTLGGANFAANVIYSFLFDNGTYYGFFLFDEELNFIRGVDYELFTISDEKLKLMDYPDIS